MQTVILVRAEFYAGINSLFRQLDEPLAENRNFALVPVFSTSHARQVLTTFGRSYGAIPETLAPKHEQFVKQAVRQLASDGSVVCIQLALFAEMMKSHPWEPASLRHVGGIGGVGVSFLEKTFCDKSAPPTHRAHENAARRVLQSLLPEPGSDLKGSARTVGQLREAARYMDNPDRFAELLRILDSDVRLITPVDSESQPGEPAETYYQLTHDFLVPALRSWLTIGQQNTRRGRAELRLTERSRSWNARNESRYLPSWWEYLQIMLFTRRRGWTTSQARSCESSFRNGPSPVRRNNLIGLRVVTSGIRTP